jgi:catechol 2,3-dioxygenase-like lactoylglutathione lyase family enzyme
MERSRHRMAAMKLNGIGQGATMSDVMLQGDAVVFSVSDMDASLFYYRDALGFSVEFKWGEPTSYAGLCRDNVALHLAIQSLAKRQPGQSALCVFVRDVDALHAEIASKGARVVKPPEDYDYGMRDFDVLDLDGNKIIFGMGSKKSDAAA